MEMKLEVVVVPVPDVDRVKRFSETLGRRMDFDYVHDDWSGWYATYLLNHGLKEILPHANRLDAAALGAVLKQFDADFRREQPASEWPAYYANRLGAVPP